LRVTAPPGACGQIWLGRLEADLLADEDDVDAAGQLLVDLQDLPDLAVLPVGDLRAGVLKRQAVPVDPFVRRCQRGYQLTFICWAWVAKSSANILFRADSHGPAPSFIASAIPAWSSVTEALVITDEPSGMRASTASRAASRSPTTSTLNPCSSSATTVACSAGSSGSVVKPSGMAVVLTAGPPLR
jgi:hypothetical protein